MKLLVALSWRNIWRNKRRSLLTVAAVTFAAFLLVVFRGVAIGTWEYSLKNTVSLSSGFLQIQRHGYRDNPSLNKSYRFPGNVESVVGSNPGVAGYAPRITADGLVSCRTNSSGTAILGIDPRSEQNVSRFHQRIREGRMVNPNHPGEVVVGYKLLANLKARVGDSLVVLAQGYDGVMGNQRYRAVGTLRMGVPAFDASSVVMNLESAQQLLAMEGRVNVVAIATDEFE